MPKYPTTYAECGDGTAQERQSSVTEFLQGLTFSRPLDALRKNGLRRPCPVCSKRRQFYCYDCLSVSAPETHPPDLTMPATVHVVYHPGEHRAKATTLPAATVSSNVKIHVWPDQVPELPEDRTVVLYPSDDAVGIEEIEDLTQIQHIVVIDATWQQSNAISADPRVTKFKRIRLRRYATLFWRFQPKKDTAHLATVEAIYYAMRQLVELRNARGLGSGCASGGVPMVAPPVDAATPPAEKAPVEKAPTEEGTEKPAGGFLSPRTRHYHGEVDDLLFYYVNQFITVQASYRDPAKANPTLGVSGGSTQPGEGYDKRVFSERHFKDYVLNCSWEDVVGTLSKNARGPAAALPTAEEMEAFAAATKEAQAQNGVRLRKRGPRTSEERAADRAAIAEADRKKEASEPLALKGPRAEEVAVLRSKGRK